MHNLLVKACVKDENATARRVTKKIVERAIVAVCCVCVKVNWNESKKIL